jgi:hypothetical protein
MALFMDSNGPIVSCSLSAFRGVKPSKYNVTVILILIIILEWGTENTAIGIRHADHVVPSIRTSWQSLRRQAAVARSV